ncbi:MAG TPA: SPOR domain-containing protein, partial [Candidatus Limnocylindria bacterium]|nr:SPOR domain-containing protein [Candidatus Limnocylindria bacterium]
RGAPARPAGAAPAKASRSTPNRQRHDHAAGEPAATRAAARYLVELGAYRERHAADAAQREVARRFPEARVTEPDAGDTYRVQLGPYAARRSAEARAQVLERLGYAASVVPAP